MWKKELGCNCEGILSIFEKSVFKFLGTIGIIYYWCKDMVQVEYLKTYKYKLFAGLLPIGYNSVACVIDSRIS